MVWPLVFTSGAGISLSGPMMIEISVVKRRVRCSSSVWLSRSGSTTTPPLAPPKGRPMMAHFQDTLRRSENAPNIAIEIENLGRAIELPLCRLELVRPLADAARRGLGHG